MKVIIEDKYLAELVDKGKTKGKPKFPVEVESTFIKRIYQIINATSTNDLRKFKSLHFEKLNGSEVHYSIRVNNAWRIIFRIGMDGEIEVLYIEELNNHYG